MSLLGCDLYINKTRSFGVITPQDTNTWIITREPNNNFPLCKQDGDKAVIGNVELQDYPKSLIEPIWNKDYGHALKKTLDFNIQENLVRCKKKFPVDLSTIHNFYIFFVRDFLV